MQAHVAGIAVEDAAGAPAYGVDVRDEHVLPAIGAGNMLDRQWVGDVGRWEIHEDSSTWLTAAPCGAGPATSPHRGTRGTQAYAVAMLLSTTRVACDQGGVPTAWRGRALAYSPDADIAHPGHTR